MVKKLWNDPHFTQFSSNCRLNGIILGAWKEDSKEKTYKNLETLFTAIQIIKSRITMKRAFMIEFDLPETFNEEFLALIPRQRDMINQMLMDGKIKSYSLSMDRAKLWTVVAANSEFEAMEIIAQLPLTDYMTPMIHELMFYNASEVMLQFSLN